MTLNTPVSITDPAVGGKEQGPTQLSPQHGWDESLNSSRPRAACAGSHKYLPLKEAALSLETTTSWAAKREEKKKKKGEKKKKEETTTQKKTPHRLWGPSSTHSSSHSSCGKLWGGNNAFPECFPSPFSCDSLNISVFCPLLSRHVVIPTPSSSAESLGCSSERGGHSRGKTPSGRGDFKGWG